ncbi:hypothetical protein C8R43DRAFT_959572 [Mycena crocata]|nr:hypothetical protein C8R43DRAFT_959572 [Mycena crocata]
MPEEHHRRNVCWAYAPRFENRTNHMQRRRPPDARPMPHRLVELLGGVLGLLGGMLGLVGRSVSRQAKARLGRKITIEERRESLRSNTDRIDGTRCLQNTPIAKHHECGHPILKVVAGDTGRARPRFGSLNTAHIRARRQNQVRKLEGGSPHTRGALQNRTTVEAPPKRPPTHIGTKTRRVQIWTVTHVEHEEYLRLPSGGMDAGFGESALRPVSGSAANQRTVREVGVLARGCERVLRASLKEWTGTRTCRTVRNGTQIEAPLGNMEDREANQFVCAYDVERTKRG